ncbi:MAG: transrane efflux protein [Actinoallomurus sp.]|nr:transrane efflux protein [Actinoallomurus sp.]
MFGPLTTVVVDAVRYLLSALGIRAIGGHEPHPPARRTQRFSTGDVVQGRRYILRHPHLRPLFFNAGLMNGLIMVTAAA